MADDVTIDHVALGVSDYDQAKKFYVATLKPLDLDPILASVARTGRCVVVTEAAQTCGVASEIAAGISEEGLRTLLAPVQRVTGYDVVPPLYRLEHENIPSRQRITSAVKKALAFS